MGEDDFAAVVRGLMQGISPDSVRMRSDLARRNARLRLAARRVRVELWGEDDMVERLEAGNCTPPPEVAW